MFYSPGKGQAQAIYQLTNLPIYQLADDIN